MSSKQKRSELNHKKKKLKHNKSRCWVSESKRQRSLRQTEAVRPSFIQRRVWHKGKAMTVLTVISAILGLVVILFLTFPNYYYLMTSPVTITGDAVVNPEDPLSSLFEIHNNGLLPIRDVEILYVVHSVDTAQSKDVLKNVSVKGEGLDISVINPRDYMTINWAPLIATSDITKADLEIVSHYRIKWPPPWGWWQLNQTSCFRFVTVQAQSGQLLWTKRETTTCSQ